MAAQDDIPDEAESKANETDDDVMLDAKEQLDDDLGNSSIHALHIIRSFLQKKKKIVKLAEISLPSCKTIKLLQRATCALQTRSNYILTENFIYLGGNVIQQLIYQLIFIADITDLNVSQDNKNDSFDESSIIMAEDDDKKVFYLFTRTPREKEEWFNHLSVAAKFMEDW